MIGKPRVEIEPISPQDSSLLYRLEMEIFEGDGFSPYFFKLATELLQPFSFVAKVENHPIGFALSMRNESQAGDVWLIDMGVLESYRGQGIGKELVRTCLHTYRRRGLTTVRLTVDPANIAAVSLYRTFAFEIEATYGQYYKPGTPRHVMSRPVDIRRTT